MTFVQSRQLRHHNDVNDLSFIVNFEQISHIVWVFPLLTLINEMLAGRLGSFMFFLPAKLFILKDYNIPTTQPVITCSKLIMETLEQGVKHVQS